ncbi:MAG: hypothetical protein NTU53_20395 [Planctomycetota bacterium]|nr:hypothetical protein [Planctomycetota bacterium]
MWYILLAIGILIVAFIWWRYTSVARGARRRDETILRLLAPTGEKLSNKEPVSAEESGALADRPHIRPMLYAMLKHFERLDLFPQKYLDPRSQGEATLAYWLMHPNEMGGDPEEIELVETVTRQFGGVQHEFFVYRYKMPKGHWASGDGWLLGLAGPFIENDVPYSGTAVAFSRCGDKHGAVEAAELVDWYIGMIGKKID